MEQFIESFILVALPLNALMRDQTVKLNYLQLSCVVVQNTESLSEIKDIKQSKYPIIHGNTEAFVGKLRRLILDCEEVRPNMRAVIIDEAWQVIISVLIYFH